MTLLEIQAIRALPEEYVIPNVKIALGRDFVMAIETNLPAIIYQDGKWLHLTAAGFPPVAEKVRKLTKSEAEAMGLSCDSKASPRLTEFDAVMWEQARIAREAQIRTSNTPQTDAASH